METVSITSSDSVVDLEPTDLEAVTVGPVVTGWPVEKTPGPEEVQGVKEEMEGSGPDDVAFNCRGSEAFDCRQMHPPQSAGRTPIVLVGAAARDFGSDEQITFTFRRHDEDYHASPVAEPVDVWENTPLAATVAAPPRTVMTGQYMPADMVEVVAQTTVDKVSTRMLVGCVPQLADEERTKENCDLVLKNLMAGLRTLFGQEAEQFNAKWEGMLCLESHQDPNALHFHWAVKFPKLTISNVRFEAIQEQVLMPLFGKHTFIEAGKSWEGNVKYMTKNLAPHGKGDAIFVTVPEINRKKQLDNKKQHVIDDQRAKIQHAVQMVTTGRAYELYHDEGLYALQMIPMVDRGIKTILRNLPVTEQLKARIARTESYWFHGASRTGKTWSAINFFCYERPGDVSSRKLDVLKVSVHGTSKGFFNGYLGQEVIVIDEIPAHWADHHDTVRSFLSLMDTYEDFINVKGDFVPKRCWRWIFCSNYEPRKVFSTRDRGVGQFAQPGTLDREGLLEPYGARFTSAGTRPERVLAVQNEYNQNGLNGHPLMVRAYDFVEGELLDGEAMTLQQWGAECYRE